MLLIVVGRHGSANLRGHSGDVHPDSGRAFDQRSDRERVTRHAGGGHWSEHHQRVRSAMSPSPISAVVSRPGLRPLSRPLSLRPLGRLTRPATSAIQRERLRSRAWSRVRASQPSELDRRLDGGDRRERRDQHRDLESDDLGDRARELRSRRLFGDYHPFGRLSVLYRNIALGLAAMFASAAIAAGAVPARPARAHRAVSESSSSPIPQYRRATLLPGSTSSGDWLRDEHQSQDRDQQLHPLGRRGCGLPRRRRHDPRPLRVRSRSSRE